MPSDTTWRVASSQAAREKMKVMAGSIPASARYSTTSVRRGDRNRWWDERLRRSSRRRPSGFGLPSRSNGSTDTPSRPRSATA